MHDGKEIKAMIDSRGIKYSRLADYLGVSRQSITKLFNTQKINSEKKDLILNWIGGDLKIEQASTAELNDPPETYSTKSKFSDDCKKEIEFLKGIIENQKETIAHLLNQSKINSK